MGCILTEMKWLQVTVTSVEHPQSVAEGAKETVTLLSRNKNPPARMFLQEDLFQKEEANLRLPVSWQRESD